MGITKLNIGKIPISKGEYQEGTAYQRLNQVTMLGSTYQSKIDDNTSAPAQMGADGAVENINTDKWLCIAVGNVSAARKVVYNNETSGLEAGNVQEAIDEVGSKVSDLLYPKYDFTNGKAIICNIGSTMKETDDSDFDSIVIPVSAGDVFLIKAVGGTQAKLWATANEYKTVKRVSSISNSLETPESVEIQDGESYIIVNTFCSRVSLSSVVCESGIQKTDSNTNRELANAKVSLRIIDGYIFRGVASISDKPKLPIEGNKFVYVASNEGTYVNHGNLVVNHNEICFLYCVNKDGVISWSKAVVAKIGDFIIAASDASEAWKSIANLVVSDASLGIDTINTYISRTAKDGETIVLSDGNFTTEAVDGKRNGINLNKSITLKGQGVKTVVTRQSTALDIVVSKDDVIARVEKVNVAHGIGIVAKDDISKYSSSIKVSNIFINNEIADVDTINYINRTNKPTLAHPDSPWRIYATKIVRSDDNLRTIKEFCYNTTYVIDSDKIEDRTILLLPATYTGANGLYFNKNIVCRLIGLKGYEKETLLKRVTSNTAYPNDIYIDNVNTQDISSKEIRIENISFYDMLSYSYCSNFHMINCYRDGILLDDYNAENIIEVGKNKICSRLSIALQAAKHLATKDNRYTIKVYGEIFDNTICDADVANTDIEGYGNATVIREGWSEGADRNTPMWHLMRTGDNWDGYIRNITFKLAGVMKGYNFAALEIKSGKANLYNVKAINLSMAGKDALDSLGNNIYVRFDDKHRMVRCYADAKSTTGYTAQVYSRIFGTPTETYECQASDASAPHDYKLFIRKPDTELNATSWDDLDGGRRYGLYFKCPTECNVNVYNCEGYGSPWGLHNTRGIYIDYGSPKLFNCIGISGGVGHRLHGIVSHRDSCADIVGCIGYASPFAYLTPKIEEYMPHYNMAASVGIKAQMMSSTKFTNCIGYGNEMPMGHGIYADNMTKAVFINCSGYTRGGENSAGFSIAEYATTNMNGGYFGRDEHTHSEDFIPNNGKGMDFYPIKRCVRHEETENDILYADHWKPTLINTDLSYRIIRLFISRYNLQGTIYAGKICKFYDVSSGTKTLIASTVLENANGNYQFIDLAKPYTIGIGHHIYIVLEDSEGNEISVSSGTKTISVSICVDILNSGQSGMFINTYWSHDGDISPENLATHLPYPICIANTTVGDNVRIGDKADTAQLYNIVNSVVRGDIIRNSSSLKPLRIFNSVKFEDDNVVDIK